MTLGPEFSPLQSLEIEGTAKLGAQFTLAAMVHGADGGPARLYSSTTDQGPVKTTELVLDCNPGGGAVAGLKLTCRGISLESRPFSFAGGKYHHAAVTYDDGVVFFYLDGVGAGGGKVPGGPPVAMDRNLFFGEHADHGRQVQLRGPVDDILVLGRALTAEQASALARDGAEAFFKANPEILKGER